MEDQTPPNKRRLQVIDYVVIFLCADLAQAAIMTLFFSGPASTGLLILLSTISIWIVHENYVKFQIARGKR